MTLDLKEILPRCQITRDTSEEPESNVSAPNVEPPSEQSNNETPGEQTQNEPAPRHPVL